MSSSTLRQSAASAVPSPDTPLLAALLLLETGLLLIPLAINRYYNRLADPSLKEALVLLGPAAIVGLALVFIYRRFRAGDSRRFRFTLAVSLTVVLIAFLTGEGLIRLLATPTEQGPRFAGTLLLPRDWEAVKSRNAELLRYVSADRSYFVSDTLLGWVPGSNRRSSDGQYFSSVEGIRSPGPNVSYTTLPLRPRIALLGDSYTYGLEVPFADSWGARMGRDLEGSADVLNFGVDGYGVDQAYLRYERDARPFGPAVAILAFVEHDLHRSMGVYTFLTFPHWGFPFAKPRFVVNGGRLQLLSGALSGPAEVLTLGSISHLPYVVHEPGYDPQEWQHRFYHSSYLVRFILSRYSRWPSPQVQLLRDHEMVQVNSEVLLRFVRRAREEGTVPLVVYLPSRPDFWRETSPMKDGVLARLKLAGVPYVDLTECLASGGWEGAFLPERPHYGAAGNAAVARCLLPLVTEALDSHERQTGVALPSSSH